MAMFYIYAATAGCSIYVAMPADKLYLGSTKCGNVGVVWCIEYCLPYNIVHYETLHSVCLSTNSHSLYDVSNDSFSGVSSTDYIHFPITTFKI